MAQKIIIASGKGGSGKTSLCSGLALALKDNGNYVLVVDCDIAQGCIDFMLSNERKAVNSWGDVITGNCELNDAVYTANGVDYLIAPGSFSDEYTTEAFKKIINELEKRYLFILFDSPAGIRGGFSLAASCADKGIIVSTPDEVCIKAASRAADELYNAGVDDVKLVINRFDKEQTQKGNFYNIDETIDGVATQLIGVVPEDKEISFASSTGFASLKDCPAKAAYERIAIRVSGGYIKLDLSNKKKNFENKKKKEKRRKSDSVLKFAFKFFAVLVALTIALVGGTTVLEIYNGNRRKEPLFEIPMLTVEKDNGKLYRGILYSFEVRYDEDGKIIFSEMKIGDRVIASAMTGKGLEKNND
ncbi:MAG: P-loop NTPase [Clostridia bacterium]|nr:P-loop NTPase [Clostridia bacterium]